MEVGGSFGLFKQKEGDFTPPLPLEQKQIKESAFLSKKFS